MNEWSEIRRRVLTEEISKREACREYELGWHTLKKILEHETPPGYRLSQPRRKPKLEPYLPIVEQILKDDLCCAVLVQRLLRGKFVHVKAVRRRKNVGAEPIDQQTSAEIVQIDAPQDPCFLGQNVRSNKLTRRAFARSTVRGHFH